MSNNKNYNKKNYYKNNNKKKDKVTYDSLLDTKINLENSNELDKLLIIRYIALTIVLFAIIICSIILFKYA